MTFTDVDLSDHQTGSITNKAVSPTLANSYALTSAQHDALVNAFTIDAATHFLDDRDRHDRLALQYRRRRARLPGRRTTW